MATTSIFAELLIAGSFSLAWMILFAIKASAINETMIQSFLALSESHSTWIFAIGILVAYQVGVIVNLTAYWILYVVREEHWRAEAAKRAKRIKLAKSSDFEDVRAIVLQNGSEQVIQELLGSLHFMRMGRTGMLNFSLLAIALFSFDTSLNGLATLSLLLAAASLPVWIMQGKRYYGRMGLAYLTIQAKSPAASK